MIRRAATEDMPALVAGLVAMVQAMEAAGGHPVLDIDKLREQFTARLDRTFQRPSMLYLVADVDNDVVGILEASHFQLESVFQPREMLHIHGVHVDAVYRRRGIAWRLMEHAFVWGRERGCTLVELNVLADNPAQHLYRAMGFTVFQYEMVRPL